MRPCDVVVRGWKWLTVAQDKVITTRVIRPARRPDMMCSICGRRFTSPLYVLSTLRFALNPQFVRGFSCLNLKELNKRATGSERQLLSLFEIVSVFGAVTIVGQSVAFW